MITIKHGDKKFSIRNNIKELKINEFENISTKLNNHELSTIDKWSDILIFLGLPEEVIDNMAAEEFIKVIKEFKFGDASKLKIKKEITVDGVTYVAYDDKFKLNVKDLALIEASIKKNQERYLGELLAIVYKRPDADRTINYDKAHIHHKAELFRKEITTDVVIPLLDYLSKNIITNYEHLQPAT